MINKLKYNVKIQDGSFIHKMNKYALWYMNKFHMHKKNK